MRTNISLMLALLGASLAGCGSSNSHNGYDSGATPADAAATSAEVSLPADTGNSVEAGVLADRPGVAVEAGHEAAISPADTSVDRAAALAEVASATDSPASPPDAASAETPRPADAPGLEAAKSSDAGAIETAKPANDLAPATLGEMSPQQLHDALANKDFLLIDVHTPNQGSIPGTDARIVYTDIDGLAAFIGPNLDTKVVLTCLSGYMSNQAGNALVARGYRNIWELTDGMNAWTKAGYTLVYLDGGT